MIRNKNVNLVFRGRRFLNRYYKRLKRFLNFKNRYEIFNGKSSCQFVMSTRDLLNAQHKAFGTGAFSMTDVVVRLISVERYLTRKPNAFQMYHEMQQKRIGENWDNRFERLIQSVSDVGYLDKHPIKVSRNLMIKDGSHRLALALHNNVELVAVEMHDEIHNRDYDLSYFVKNNFSQNQTELIANRQIELLRANRVRHVAILWPTLRPFFEEITQLLSSNLYSEFEEIQTKTIRVPEDDLFDFIRLVYQGDDIEEYKLLYKYQSIIKSTGKLQHYDVCVVEFFSVEKKIKVKSLSGQPQAVKVLVMKQDLRQRYKIHISHYVHDIALHVSDNDIQTMQIYDGFDYFWLSFEELFKDLKDIQYFAIKLESPRQRSDFPHRFLIRSDIDIYVRENDFLKLKSEILKFVNLKFNYSTVNVEMVEEAFGSRIRLVSLGNLIFQFDIKTGNPHFSEEFFELCFSNIEPLTKTSLVKQLIRPLESVFRIYEYSLRKSKYWHLDFLRENSDMVDKMPLSIAFSEANILRRIEKTIRQQL